MTFSGKGEERRKEGNSRSTDGVILQSREPLSKQIQASGSKMRANLREGIQKGIYVS